MGSIYDQKNLFVRTPIIESTVLSGYCNKKVLLKLENCQPSGSFKMRGISRLCQHAASNGCKQIISSSGGNAGLAAAVSARLLGLKCHIVVPKTTSKRIRDMIEREGSEVEIFGNVWNEANERAIEISEQSDDNFNVHPFDHKIIWSGHSTMVDEIARDIDSMPSMIVSCCGGGGLLCGIIQGMRRHGWTSVPILAMETIGAHSLNAAVKAGGVPVRIPGITSIATCLGSVVICDQLAEEYRRASPPILSHLVEDREAVNACLKFLDDNRILVEPSCGAALAALYSGLVKKLLENYLSDGPVIVIVCGGSAITLDQLNEWRIKFDL